MVLRSWLLKFPISKPSHKAIRKVLPKFLRKRFFHLQKKCIRYYTTEESLVSEFRGQFPLSAVSYVELVNKQTFSITTPGHGTLKLVSPNQFVLGAWVNSVTVSQFDLTVRSYDDCRERLVADFAEWAGLPSPPAAERRNTSLCREALELMVRVNALADPAKESKRRALANSLEAMQGERYTLPEPLARRIRETYADANERVRERWINKQPATSDSPLSRPGPRQSPNRTVAA